MTPTYSSRPSMYCSTIAAVPMLSWMNATRSFSFSSVSTTDACEMPIDASCVNDFTINGIDSGPARELAPERGDGIQYLCKRAYRALELSGYARIDLRMDDAGNVWVLEANPNPQIARGEDFAASAEKVGISYDGMLQRIVNLGLRWQPESVA